MNDKTNVYTAVCAAFQIASGQMGRVAKANLIAEPKDRTAVGLESGRQFQQLKSALTGLDVHCKRRLRKLFGELVTQLADWVSNTHSDSVHALQVVDNHVYAANRLAQRITADYIEGVDPLPVPRKLIVGTAELIVQLADGRLVADDLDRAIFWLPETDDVLYPGKIGMNGVVLLHQHPEMGTMIVEKIRRAVEEKRVAIDYPLAGTADLDAVLVRHGIAPVGTSDFLYAFFSDEKEGNEFKWTAEIYGFEVV